MKKSKRLIRRYGILAGNIALIFVVGFIVWQSQIKAEDSIRQSSSDTGSTDQAGPVDSISAADIATNVAYATSLPQADNVRGQADSLNVSLVTATSDEVSVVKPQIISGGSQSRKDIIKYVAVAGDTVSKIATEFNVSSNSIKWSNNLSGETVAAGKELLLPPRGRNGIVYLVQSGDTAQSVADKFRSSKEKVESFNDAEITGLPVGEYIFIPDGEKTPDPVVSLTSFWSVNPIYAGNGYSYGYCTFWAAKRRADIGRPIPSNWGNAYSWDEYARAMGYSVSKTPTVGSIVQDDGGQYYYIYHVAFVEEVYPDGSILVSEMNVRGWNVVSRQVIPAAVVQRGILDFID